MYFVYRYLFVIFYLVIIHNIRKPISCYRKLIIICNIIHRSIIFNQLFFSVDYAKFLKNYQVEAIYNLYNVG